MNKTYYTFVPNILDINVQKLAVVLQAVGVNITTENYNRLPPELRAHFKAIEIPDEAAAKKDTDNG